MRNSKIVELNSDLELLSEHELYAFKGGLAGGQSEHDIEEVIITVPGGDHGGDNGDGDNGDNPTWDDNDPPYGDDGDDPFPPDNGGGGEVDPSNADGILEEPSWKELWWLGTQVPAVKLLDMRHNKNLALQYGPGHNDVGDALRHALWSALDAADIGLAKAKEFHTLHETEHPENPLENAMDLHNNNWGFEWFQAHGNPENNIDQFLHDFNIAVANGQIKTHP